MEKSEQSRRPSQPSPQQALTREPTDGYLISNAVAQSAMIHQIRMVTHAVIRPLVGKYHRPPTKMTDHQNERAFKCREKKLVKSSKVGFYTSTNKDLKRNRLLVLCNNNASRHFKSNSRLHKNAQVKPWAYRINF